MKLKKSSCLILLIFLPNCLFHNSTSRKYDCARATYENILYKYERDLALFESMQQATSNQAEQNRLAQELKDEILLKNEEYNSEHAGFFSRKNAYANYPFTQYKNALDCNINLLEKTKTQLYWKQEGLGRSFQDLISSLDQLRKYIVLNSEYSHERKMIEQAKLTKPEKSTSQLNDHKITKHRSAKKVLKS